MKSLERVHGTTGIKIIIGSAFFWAWLDALFMSMFFVRPEAEGFMAEMATIAVFGLSLPWLALSLAKPAACNGLLAKKRVPLAFAALGTAGSLLLLLAGINLNWIALVAGGTCAGAFMAAYQLAWGAAYCHDGERSATPYVAGGFACAIVVDAPLLFMIPEAAAVFSALLPLVSGALFASIDPQLRTYRRTAPVDPLPKRSVRSRLKAHLGTSMMLLCAVDDAIATCSVAQAKKLLDGDTMALNTLKEQIASYRSEKKDLLKKAGLSADYLETSYECPDCKDTGFIDGKRCHCFTQAAIDLVYTQSNLKSILLRENFSTFSFDYYSDKDINPATGLSSLATAKDAVAKCHDFIDHFDDTFSNLYFYGDTGIGKTFLSNCVAKELMDHGHSVIYFTAFQLFDILSKGVFAKDEEAIAANENIFTCDLLIIDDLGTELTNSFTTSQLFLCLNERILHRKSTIISTNLGLSQLTDLYSERILSRIMDNYVLIKLFGEDIRMQKRRR